MQSDAFAEPGARIESHMRKQPRRPADVDGAANDTVRADADTVADHGLLAYHRIFIERNAGADLRAAANSSSGMHGGNVLLLTIEPRQHLQQRSRGLSDNDSGWNSASCIGELRGYQHNTGGRRSKL